MLVKRSAGVAPEVNLRIVRVARQMQQQFLCYVHLLIMFTSYFLTWEVVKDSSINVYL